MDVQVGMTPTA